MHVDEYIESWDGNPYAQFVLHLFRLPAAEKGRWQPWIDQHPLYCTYQDQRYRVVGASRLGDIWLKGDGPERAFYDLRVDVETCTDWSNQ